MAIKIGVEIEAITNMEILEDRGINVGDYRHGSYFSDNFKAETDSSIDDTDFRLSDDYETMGVEFISRAVSSKAKFINLVDELKSKAFNNARLSDCMVFNNSCGMHTHFSIPGGIGNKVRYELYGKMREMFLAKIKSSGVLPEATKTAITNQYYRGYAKKFSKDSWKKKHHDRYWEFNFISEEKGKGMEWRSVNVRDIRTWEEMKEVFTIIYDCIKWLVDQIGETNVREKKKVVISKRKITSLLR